MEAANISVSFAAKEREKRAVGGSVRSREDLFIYVYNRATRARLFVVIEVNGSKVMAKSKIQMTSRGLLYHPHSARSISPLLLLP